MSRSNPIRLLILITIASLLLSCTPHFRWRDLQDQLTSIQSLHRPLEPPSPYRDFAGAIHVHTMLSHDSEGSLDEIVEASRKAGSAFVITTDHHQSKVYQRGFEGWFEDILVIRGSEIIKGCKGFSGAGCNSLLVLGLDEYIDTGGLTMPQVVNKVKALGGLALAAHPEGYVDWNADIDGMEIYDILDDAVDKRWKFPKWFFDILYSYNRYRDVVFLSILDPPQKGLMKWDELTQTRRIVAIAGNDSHQNIHYLGKQIDPYDLALRFVRTHILADNLGEKEVLDALDSGHAYVSFDSLVDATGFGFWVQDEDSLSIMGDEVALSRPLTLKIQTPVPGRITVLRNGIPIHHKTGKQYSLPVIEAGVYRVEVHLEIRGKWWPWIYSNPIYVRDSILPDKKSRPAVH